MTVKRVTLGRTNSPRELLRSAMEDISASWYPGDCGSAGESLEELEGYALDPHYSFEGQDCAQRAWRKIEKALAELQLDRLGIIEEASSGDAGLREERDRLRHKVNELSDRLNTPENYRCFR